MFRRHVILLGCSVMGVALIVFATAQGQEAKPSAEQSQPAKPDAKSAPPARQPTSPEAPPGPAPKGTNPYAPTVVLKPGEVPAVKFDTPSHNFGRVKAGTEIKHDFWFTNTGTGPLEILRVKPSCGCTQAGQHDRVVLPGETGKIPIRVDSNKLPKESRKSIAVFTNCPGEQAQVSIEIVGEVWKPVEVAPTTCAFGRITQDALKTQALVRKVTITNNTEKPANIINVRSDSPAFVAEVKPIQDGKTFELSVSVAGPVSAGQNSAEIELETGVEESPTLKIPVHLFVSLPVDVTPAKLSLPSPRSSVFTGRLYVRNNAADPVKVTGVEASNPALKVAVEEMKVGMMYRVNVDVPPDYRSPAHGDSVTIRTSSPDVPVLTVQVLERSTSAPLGSTASAAGTPASVVAASAKKAAGQGGAASGGSGNAGAADGSVRTAEKSKPAGR